MPVNPYEAERWFRRAAERGDAEAQNELGVAYGLGAGVRQSDAEAVSWYRKAANQGLARAQFNLGAMYEDGDGVPQSAEQAIYWFRRAARQGHADARKRLASLQARDLKPPPDDDLTDEATRAKDF